MAQFQFRIQTGTGSASNSTASATIITNASTSGNGILRILGGFISVTTASGGGGLAQLTDGSSPGTGIVVAPAGAVGYFPFYFGDRGYPLTAGNNLILNVTGGTSTQATAYASVLCYLV